MVAPSYLLTVDELFSLVQITLIVLGFLALVLIFIHLAYERK